MKIIVTGGVSPASAPIRRGTDVIVLECPSAIKVVGAATQIAADNRIVLRRAGPDPALQAAAVLAKVVRWTERFQRAPTPTAFGPLAGRS